MEKTVWAVLVALVLAVVGCHLVAGGGPGQTGEYVPPPKPRVADNSRCFVCHINYDGEELVALHAKASVGCETCHGMCDDHCNDENNITPPDIMYPGAKINPSCMKCHPRSALAKENTHKPLLEATASKQRRCTDCHGKHRLERRTVRWDKKTGKLLPEDESSK